MIETWDEAYESYNDYLNEIHGPIKILGMEFTASRVLEDTDPVAYRTHFFDYMDSMGIDTDDLEGNENG